MAHEMPDIKGKPRQSKGLVAKAIRKKVISRTTSKHIYDKTTARVSEKYLSWKQRKHNKKNDKIKGKKRSK